MRPEIPSGSAFLLGNKIYFCSSAKGVVGSTLAPPYIELEREAPKEELGKTIELVLAKATTERLTSDTVAPLAKMAKMRRSTEFLRKSTNVRLQQIGDELHLIPTENLGRRGCSHLPDKAIILPVSASPEEKGEGLLIAFDECERME